MENLQYLKESLKNNPHVLKCIEKMDDVEDVDIKYIEHFSFLIKKYNVRLKKFKLAYNNFTKMIDLYKIILEISSENPPDIGFCHLSKTKKIQFLDNYNIKYKIYDDIVAVYPSCFEEGKLIYPKMWCIALSKKMWNSYNTDAEHIIFYKDDEVYGISNKKNRFKAFTKEDIPITYKFFMQKIGNKIPIKIHTKKEHKIDILVMFIVLLPFISIIWPELNVFKIDFSYENYNFNKIIFGVFAVFLIIMVYFDNFIFLVYTICFSMFLSFLVDMFLMAQDDDYLHSKEDYSKKIVLLKEGIINDLQNKSKSETVPDSTYLTIDFLLDKNDGKIPKYIILRDIERSIHNENITEFKEKMKYFNQEDILTRQIFTLIIKTKNVSLFSEGLTYIENTYTEKKDLKSEVKSIIKKIYEDDNVVFFLKIIEFIKDNNILKLDEFSILSDSVNNNALNILKIILEKKMYSELETIYINPYIQHNDKTWLFLADMAGDEKVFKIGNFILTYLRENDDLDLVRQVVNKYKKNNKFMGDFIISEIMSYGNNKNRDAQIKFIFENSDLDYSYEPKNIISFSLIYGYDFIIDDFIESIHINSLNPIFLEDIRRIAIMAGNEDMLEALTIESDK
jgi:hypothetical protein